MADRFYTNKDTLVAALQDYDGFVKRLFNMCNDYYKSHKELKKVNSINESLKEKITEVEKERDFYKNEYLKFTVLSESPTARKDNNIKNNVIKLNKKEVSIGVDSLERMFEEFEL